MMRKARLTAAIAATFASLAGAGAVQAQEANAWDVEQLIGRTEMRSIAQQSRDDVVAELRQARAEGTYHAGNEGSVPQDVLERRMMANQREGERIARAYQDEAARVAQILNTPARAPAMPQAAEPTVIVVPVQPASVVVVPVEPATPQTAAPSEPTATTQSVTPNDTSTPPEPDVRPNEEMASGERRTPPDSTSTTVPPRGDAPPVAPGSEAAQPNDALRQAPNDVSPATRIEQQTPAPQETRSVR